MALMSVTCVGIGFESLWPCLLQTQALNKTSKTGALLCSVKLPLSFCNSGHCFYNKALIRTWWAVLLSCPMSRWVVFSFNEFRLHGSKQMLSFYHALNCSHCKTLLFLHCKHRFLQFFDPVFEAIWPLVLASQMALPVVCTLTLCVCCLPFFWWVVHFLKVRMCWCGWSYHLLV